MICVKCGEKLEPSAKFCGECGNIVSELTVSHEDEAVGQLIDSIEAKKKIKKRIGVIAVSFLALLFITGIIIYNISFGLNASIRKYMKAFEAGNGEAMYDLASDNTKQFVCEYYSKNANYYDVTYYFGTDFTKDEVLEYIEVIYTENLKSKSESFFYDFDKKLGSSYKTSYKIVEIEDIDSETLSYFNQDIHEITNSVTFTEIKEITVEVTGKSKGNKYSDELTFYMSKEGLTWKVLFAENVF